VELARRARAAKLLVMEIEAGHDRRSAPRETGAKVIRLRPLRVLIVSGDHRFRAVIEMLMARRGCSASSTSPSDSIARTVLDERVDVALVDGVAALREVAEAIAQGDPSLPTVGVVVVAERNDPAPAGLRTLAKWGAFDELFAAVIEAERARSRPRSTDAQSASGPRELREHELG
jgi:DNA-binding NtrC family response regulator